jgi:hypothetical protein
MKTRQQTAKKNYPDADQAPLSPRLAFVVQFRANSGGATKFYSGRVEHMTSGRVTHFHSRAELWTFLTQMLAEEERVRKEQESRSHLHLEHLPDEES